MALTGAQKAQCRKALGWPFGFNDRSSLLEQSFSGLETKPDEELLLTDTLVNGGILASLTDIEQKLVLAHKRLKADAVGSIKLNRAEIDGLRREGSRFVATLSRLLGVPVRDGGQFSPGIQSGYDSMENYVGK